MELSWFLDQVSNCLSSTTIIVAGAVLAIALVYNAVQNSNLPPGPTGIPVLGFWPFIDLKEHHLQFERFKKKYGDVFSFTCTGTLYINLGSHKALREALITNADCFSKRSETFNYLNDIFAGGILAQNNEQWKVHRKYFIQSFKERVTLSVKDLLSGSLYDSVNSTIDHLKKKTGETINIVELLTDKCNANMRLTMFGENGISEERVKIINELYVAIMYCFTSPNLLVTGKIARYLILPLTPGYKESKQNTRKITKMLYQIIDEHKATFDENNIRDIIDEYIREKLVRGRKGDVTAQYFTDRALMSSLIQFVGDGVFSVAAFIALFVNTLLDHPEEQDKIHMELVEVVGTDRQPSIEDRSRLSYTNAFMQEALRFSDMIALFPTLECTQETTLRGYRIPKGSCVVLNTYNIHNDLESYEEPRTFNPSRFIVTEGKRKPEPIVTFGVGRRACIGENFAMVQVFLFLTALVKNFHISSPDNKSNGQSELFTEGRLRVVLRPRN